ncbi:MAG: flagellar filament capping protein FliD [Candidatus Korobacteraceae bacterium]
MSTSSTSLYSGTISSILGNVNDAFSGKTSGIDVGTIVDELMEVERQPETVWQNEQSTISSQVSALTTMNTQLSTVATDVDNLKDILGAFSQMSTGSSDDALVSASADNTAVAGTHTVVVSNLATTSSSYSDYIPSGSSLAGAEIDIKYGSDPSNPVKTDTIDIPSSDTTLQQAVSTINAGGYGVTASVVTDSTGSRLVLASNTSGANGNLTVSSSASNFTSAAGVDAKLTVDGVPVDSATNTVTGAITGVTLSLGSADPNTSVLISVQPDTTTASTAIQTFVNDYNALMGSINSQYTLDSNGNEGVLASDSMLRTLQSQLLGLVSTSTSAAGQYVNLQSMGIEMQDDGTLQIDSTALSTALSSNYSDVQSFFQSTSPVGWGQTVSTQLQQMTDPTEGLISADISGLNQTNSSLTDEINDFEVRMTATQQQLTTQYDNLNTLLEEYPMQMQQVAAQLGSLPTTSTSTSSS